MSGLTKKQKAFVEYYLQTLNPFESAILAGFPKENAVKKGNALLKNQLIIDEISSKLNCHAKNLYVTKAYIIANLIYIIEFSITKDVILNKDGTQSDKYKLKDASVALKAISALSKFIEGCEKITQDDSSEIDVENLNIENI